MSHRAQRCLANFDVYVVTGSTQETVGSSDESKNIKECTTTDSYTKASDKKDVETNQVVTEISECQEITIFKLQKTGQ